MSNNNTAVFSDFNLNPSILSAINAQEFTTPTPIQAAAIPVVLSGRDLIGLAQTGTGKTAAFALPILQKLSASESKKPRALVLAPTRELAQQINDVILSFSGETNLRSMSIYGGAPIERQIGRLKKGVDIIVGCPGRVLDHLDRRTMDLSGIEMLVLDEADQMFDMGFLPTIRKILQKLPKERQSLLFSATMPESIRRLAQEILKNPESINVGSETPPTLVSHAIYPVSPQLKTDLLLKILEHTDTQSVLVFARTKHRAKKISQILEDKGLSVTCLQGNLSHNRRAEAMSGFRKGEYQIMVATDIAARGVDISTISHVINYDIPDSVEAYTHRIGRTGRAARTGDAFTLVTGEDRAMVEAIERAIKMKIERKELADFDYKAMPKASKSRENRESRPRDFNRRPREGKRDFGDSGSRDRRYGAKRQDRAPRSNGYGAESGSERSDFGKERTWSPRPEGSRSDRQRAPRGFDSRPSRDSKDFGDKPRTFNRSDRSRGPREFDARPSRESRDFGDRSRGPREFDSRPSRESHSFGDKPRSFNRGDDRGQGRGSFNSSAEPRGNRSDYNRGGSTGGSRTGGNRSGGRGRSYGSRGQGGRNGSRSGQSWGQRSDNSRGRSY